MVNYPYYCCSSSHQLRWVRRCKRSGRLISARPVACSTARTAMEHAQQTFLTFAISSHIKIRPEVIYTDILVGGLEHFLFFHISGMSSSYHPNWFSYFQRGWQHQPEAIIYIPRTSACKFNWAPWQSTSLTWTFHTVHVLLGYQMDRYGLYTLEAAIN